MSVLYTMETIILPRGLLMVHSGSLTFQKTNNIPHTGNYFLEFMLLLIILLIGAVIYITVNLRRNLKPHKPAKIKKFTDFQNNTRVKKEITPTTSKPLAKVKNAQKSIVDKSPVRVSNKKRSSGSPAQSTTTQATAKKKASRLTYPHHPLLKNVCQRDLSEENKQSNAAEILPIRKAVDSRGNRKTDNEQKSKSKKSTQQVAKEVEPVVKGVSKRQSAQTKKKESVPEEAQIVVEPAKPRFLMPEYTKQEMAYIEVLSNYVIPYHTLPDCGFPYVIADEVSYGVFFNGTYPKRKRDFEIDQSASSSDDSASETNSSSDSSEGIQTELDDGTRRCCRCRTKFHVYKNSRCSYHVGKLCKYSGFQYYTCCGADRKAQGCTMAQQHVWTGVTPGTNGPVEGFVVTEPSYSYKHRVVAIDCEMCFTIKGLELTRVTVLDLRGTIIYDTLVRPESPIIDYNTRFSGLTEDSFRKSEAVATLQEVQECMLELIDCYTIVIGHGLENDFRALKMVHYTVIDTALIFREITYEGELKRHSLRNLCRWHLNRRIQTSSEGHNSVEDALSCLDLMSNLVLNLFYYRK